MRCKVRRFFHALTRQAGLGMCMVLVISFASGLAAEERTDNTVDASRNSDLLNEDFSFIFFPPTGWSIYQLASTDLSWERDTSTSNSASGSAGHGSAASGNYDNWLVTPALNFAGGAYLLSFFERGDFMFRDGHLGVWVSTGSCDPADGDYVQRYQVPDTNNFNWRETEIDLSDLAGEGSVCIAFRYLGTDSPVWRVDDVRVRPAGVALFEPFTDTDFPPDGWEEFRFGVFSPSWARTTSAFNSPPASAFQNFSLTGNLDSWLTTPPLDLSDDVYELRFFERATSMSLYGYSGVWASTGSCDPVNGQYQELYVVPASGDFGWRQVVIDLSSLSGQSAVCLAFRYTGQGAHAWYIDDVLVRTPLPDPLFYDRFQE